MEPHFCNFHFQSNVDVLAPVRRFVSDIVERLIKRPEVASRIEIAVHELAENSMKYSAGTGARIAIEVFDVPGQMRVVVRTTNQASPEYLAQLRELVTEMKAAPDPISYYLKMLDRSATRTHGSGLGLARVFAESGMQVSYESEGDQVTVTAEFRVPSSSAPAG